MRVEEVKPYGGSEKGEEVRDMFDAIAPAYDFMNRMMTFGMCGWWRDRALSRAGKLMGGIAPERILDVATGTGDVAFALAARYPEAHITGIDLSEGMLAKAREKLKSSTIDGGRMEFLQGDSLSLPFPDASFDMITVAYGVRNFADLKRGLQEMRRVLRPGGVLCIIELSEPAHQPVRWGYRLYSRNIIPWLGRRVSRDARAYSYLPESIAACPQRGEMTALMRECGFTGCRYHGMTLGVVTVYAASADER